MESVKIPIGVYVAVVIIAISLIAMLIFRKDIKSILSGDTDEPPLQSAADVLQQVQNILDTTTPNDNSSDNEDFAATAQSIAETQYQELIQFNIDEVSLLNMLTGLNGAQLRMVFEEFGSKPWSPTFGVPTNLNLFQFYNERLDSSVWWGETITLDWDGTPAEWVPTNIPTCDSLTYSCSEKDAFRAVWWRSGLPLTF